MSTMGNWNGLSVLGILLCFEHFEDAKECSLMVRLNLYQNHFINVWQFWFSMIKPMHTCLFFYVLLTSKTQQIYSHAFKWIEATIDQKISITCDFEIALQNAISKNVPGVVINGCLFHWKQAIWRKIIELNFKENVCERMMWENSLEVLTLINPNEIRWKGIPYVRSIVDDGL